MASRRENAAGNTDLHHLPRSWDATLRRIRSHGADATSLGQIDQALIRLVTAMRDPGENDATATTRLMRENDDLRRLLIARSAKTGDPLTLPNFDPVPDPATLPVPDDKAFIIASMQPGEKYFDAEIRIKTEKLIALNNPHSKNRSAA